MVRVMIAISEQDLSLLLEGGYTEIHLERSTVSTGGFAQVTTLNIDPSKKVYYYLDVSGSTDHWYRHAFHQPTIPDTTDFTEPRQYGTNTDKIGWSFGNYSPVGGEWGEVLTAHDLRYTYLFGIEPIAEDTARSEWSDEQFKFYIDQAVGDFETWLSIDIRKRIYKTRPDAALKRSKVFRPGIDYTDIEDTYDFDRNQWSNYGFVQLRHCPIISMERAILNSPMDAPVVDLLERGWVRLERNVGQVHLFPRRQFTDYGPFSVYGMPWMFLASRFPQALEFDYTTGYETAEYVPEDLRGVIGMWSSVRALDAIGDGLLAGFSSQSVSLDGLSESFSSTQSATSAYFGARIKSYLDQIKDWMIRNRYKYGAPPIGFVGT